MEFLKDINIQSRSGLNDHLNELVKSSAIIDEIISVLPKAGAKAKRQMSETELVSLVDDLIAIRALAEKAKRLIKFSGVEMIHHYDGEETKAFESAIDAKPSNLKTTKIKKDERVLITHA